MTGFSLSMYSQEQPHSAHGRQSGGTPREEGHLGVLSWQFPPRKGFRDLEGRGLVPE